MARSLSGMNRLKTVRLQAQGRAEARSREARPEGGTAGNPWRFHFICDRLKPMKAACARLLVLLTAWDVVRAQEKPAAQPDPIQSLNQWMEQNLDDNVLDALQEIDQDRVREFFRALQQRFEGTNLLELSSLRDAAAQALPVLKQFEETRPYAAWLETHLDYLDVAEQLRHETQTARPIPGAKIPSPAPPLQLERQVWARELEQRPWPPLAHEYVPRLKDIFKTEHLPPELVWVAEVESSFNAKARSPAGAAGMFQLMPATARDQKLSLWPVDERLQTEKSARAAARYLRELHNRYDDWELALAAYNAGGGRVDKLLKQETVRTFAAIARHLPSETQMYVPKIEATVLRREGRTVNSLQTPTP